MEAEEKRLEEIKHLIRKAEHITVLTGAGMSVESGVAPFRGENGLWEKYDAEEYASLKAFEENPEKSWRLFKIQIKETMAAEPHEGHRALAELEKRNLESIITQNIDGLHQRAGNENVIELHGSLSRLICPSCDRKYETQDFLETIMDDEIPTCDCGDILRPEVVLFGEPLPERAMERTFAESNNCDLMFVVGTSAVVQPAASIPIWAKSSGAEIVELNLERTPLTDEISDHFLKGKAGDILPSLLD